MLLPATSNMAGDNETARSLFLAALMVTSVMTGILFFDIEKEGVNAPPLIESDVPDSYIIGQIVMINITISDEERGGLAVLITLNGEEITEELDEEGTVGIDVSTLEVGPHELVAVATDSLGQETVWRKVFSVNYPEESETLVVLDVDAFEIPKGETAPITGYVIHDSIDSCSLRWSTGDISQSSLGLPVDENGTFDLSLSNVQENTTVSIRATCGVWTESSMTVYASINIKEDQGATRGCTDSSANNYDENANEDDGSCEYDSQS